MRKPNNEPPAFFLCALDELLAEPVSGFERWDLTVWSLLARVGGGGSLGRGRGWGESLGVMSSSCVAPGLEAFGWGSRFRTASFGTRGGGGGEGRSGGAMSQVGVWAGAASAHLRGQQRHRHGHGVLVRCSPGCSPGCCRRED